MMIYVDDQYKSKVSFNLNTYEHWEVLIVKVQGNSLSKTFTTGNIYRSPRTRNEDLNAFIDEFTPIISSLDNCNNGCADKTPSGQNPLGQNPLGQNPLGQNPLHT